MLVLNFCNYIFLLIKGNLLTKVISNWCLGFAFNNSMVFYLCYFQTSGQKNKQNLHQLARQFFLDKKGPISLFIELGYAAIH